MMPVNSDLIILDKNLAFWNVLQRAAHFGAKIRKEDWIEGRFVTVEDNTFLNYFPGQKKPTWFPMQFSAGDLLETDWQVVEPDKMWGEATTNLKRFFQEDDIK